MKISELILKLVDQKHEHGDIDVMFLDGECFAYAIQDVYSSISLSTTYICAPTVMAGN